MFLHEKNCVFTGSFQPEPPIGDTTVWNVIYKNDFKKVKVSRDLDSNLHSVLEASMSEKGRSVRTCKFSKNVPKWSL